MNHITVIVFVTVLTLSSNMARAQLDTISLDSLNDFPSFDDSVANKRKLTNFDFETSSIFLCMGKHLRPIDPRCFANELDVFGQVSHLRVKVVSHRHRRDTTMLAFDFDTDYNGLIFRTNNSEAPVFLLDTENGRLELILSDSTQNPSRNQWDVYRRRKRDSVPAFYVDESIKLDCSSNVSHTFWSNGNLKEEYGIYNCADGHYSKIREYDSIGYMTMYVEMRDDSIIYSLYHEIIPGTGYASEHGRVLSVDPLRKEAYFKYDYEFDQKNNWIKRIKYEDSEIVETVERKIHYLSNSRINIHSQAFESLYGPCGGDKHSYTLEFEGYDVIYSNWENLIYSTDRKGKTKWSKSTKKIEGLCIAYIDRIYIHNFKYDLAVRFVNGDMYYLKSKNGRMKYPKR